MLAGERITVPKRTFVRVLLLLLSSDAIIGTLMIVFRGRGAVVRFLPDEVKREATDLFIAGTLSRGARLGPRDYQVAVRRMALDDERPRRVVVQFRDRYGIAAA